LDLVSQHNVSGDRARERYWWNDENLASRAPVQPIVRRRGHTRHRDPVHNNAANTNMNTAVPPWIASAIGLFAPTFSYTVIKAPIGNNGATAMKTASTRRPTRSQSSAITSSPDTMSRVPLAHR